MRHTTWWTTAATVLLIVAAPTAQAQEMRRSAGGGGSAGAENGEPRNAGFPFAGLWRGVRTMPMGNDAFGLRFSAIDGKYVGYMIMGEGGRILDQNLASTTQGLTWESPNSGGGTWVYHVRLAAQDSLVGTLVLRDAPAGFPEVPKGTLVLTRVLPAKASP